MLSIVLNEKAYMNKQNNENKMKLLVEVEVDNYITVYILEL